MLGISEQPQTELSFGIIWKDIKDTITKILTNSTVSRNTWSESIKAVYVVCTSRPINYARRFYDEIEMLLNGHVHDLQKELQCLKGTERLTKYHSLWKTYFKAANYINQMCASYNQIFSRNHERGTLIKNLCLCIWRRKILGIIKRPLVKYTMNSINKNRTKETEKLDKVIIREIIESYFIIGQHNKDNTMEAYRTAFETPFLKILQNCYFIKFSKCTKQGSITSFIEKIIDGINLHKSKAFKYLHEETVQKARQYFVDVIVAQHGDWLLKEAEMMLIKNMKNELELINLLLKLLTRSSSSLMTKLVSYIHKKLMEKFNINLFQEENAHLLFVDKLFESYESGLKLIKDVFENNKVLITAFEKAFASIINYHQNEEQPANGPELIARYYDYLLKKPAKNEEMKKESEIRENLDKVLSLYKYIQDKDVFQKFYINLLAKRFFRQLSISLDLENYVSDRLKNSHGFAYTFRLHKMIADMTLSPDLNSKFKNYMQLKEIDESTINFSVNVLQSGIWPLVKQNPISLHVPLELKNLIQNFNIFYKSEFENRKLMWLYNLSHGELQFNYLKKKYLVTAHAFQIAILLLFENCDFIKCNSMADSLQLTHDEVVNHVTSLVFSDILKKSTKGKINKDTILSLNFDYYNQRSKFKIKVIKPKHESQNTDIVEKQLIEERQLILQATIVRIMKKRKKIKHDKLVKEILEKNENLFQPSTELIKTCIKILIDKLYMVESKEDTHEYIYIE